MGNRITVVLGPGQMCYVCGKLGKEGEIPDCGWCYQFHCEECDCPAWAWLEARDAEEADEEGGD